MEIEEKKMYISENITSLLQERMSEELKSANIYRCMYLWLTYKGLKNLGKMYKKWYYEEYQHYEKIEQYLLDRCIKPYIPAIPEMNHDYTSVKQIFEITKELEELVETGYKKIYLESFKEDDYTTLELVNYFLKEQVEELSKIGECLKKLEMTGEDERGLFMLDLEYKNSEY